MNAEEESKLSNDYLIRIHYSAKQFTHRPKTPLSHWNDETLENLMHEIREKYGLKEKFILYDLIDDEEFIIDDVDDLIDIFESDESDDNDINMSNSNKIAHLHIKDYDHIERAHLRVTSYCLIYSRSKQKWYEGVITKIYGSLKNEWLTVKYNKKSTKEIQRNSTDLQPMPSDSILSLRIGSKCIILSDYSHLWYEGEVMSILNDDDGQWLAIKYTENNLEKIADIQRGSDQLKIFNTKNYKILITDQLKEKEAATMMSRINGLSKMQDDDRDKEVKDLLLIFSAILKSPFNPKFQTINMITLKKKFTKYPICIELLYDAGFIKSDNGKKLKFSINKMKLLKKTMVALVEQFNEIAKNIEEKLEKEQQQQQQENEEALESLLKRQEEALGPLIHGHFGNFANFFPLMEINDKSIMSNNSASTSTWEVKSLFQ